MDDAPEKSHRLTIDWTVNLTTLASIALALATGSIAITQIQAQNDKRLSLLEAQQLHQTNVDAQQDSTLRDQLQLIRQSLDRIENAQQRLAEARQPR